MTTSGVLMHWRHLDYARELLNLVATACHPEDRRFTLWSTVELELPFEAPAEHRRSVARPSWREVVRFAARQHAATPERALQSWERNLATDTPAHRALVSLWKLSFGAATPAGGSFTIEPRPTDPLELAA